MSRRVSSVVGLLATAALALPSATLAAPYAYHTYNSMVSDLQALESAHPGLAELTTAQDAFGLPTVPDGANQLEQYILRITNEATGFDKPEVLLVGVQHGDEVVSLEVCLAIAELLLESYGSDPWLTALVDRREIYMIPLANPHGFNHGVRWSPGGEGSSEDMNRDHVYDRDVPCGFGCEDETTLSTVGGQAIHELARRHLFRVMLDYHGGIELILHPWGSPIHNSDTESPDDTALDALGQRMRTYGGNYNGFTPVGTASDLLGPVHGPLDDSGYASSWDAANADAMWPTDGFRALSYTIEISNQKRPPASTLGGDAELLVPGGSEDGYVPKNVRTGLAAIDIAEPYILWTNRDAVPTQVDPGDTVTVEWQVRGCFDVDETRVRWGTDPDPRITFDDQTAAQQQTTGTPCFGTVTTFSANVTLASAGLVYLTPVARVDDALLAQGSPLPNVSPQTWVVRTRTEDGFFFQNATDPGEINTVRGQLYWDAEPLAIQVGPAGFTDGFESGDTSAWSLTVP